MIAPLRPFRLPAVLAVLASSSSASLGCAPAPAEHAAAARSSTVVAELWIRDPERLAAPLIAGVMRAQGMTVADRTSASTLAAVLRSGQPPELAVDLDQIDTTRPIGVVWSTRERGAPPGFAMGAFGRDAVRLPSAIADYASRQRESFRDTCSFGERRVPCWQARSGRWLTTIDGVILLTSDRDAMEDGTERLLVGLRAAPSQASLVMAHVTKGWIGATARDAFRTWADGQLGGVRSGPAFDFLRDGERSLDGSLAGAGDADLALDLAGSDATLTGTLHADDGSPFSAWLAGVPTSATIELAHAPREASEAYVFRLNAPWLEAVSRFLTLPPPGVTIPADVLAKTTRVFEDFRRVLTGEVTYYVVSQPERPTNVVTFALRDAQAARPAIEAMGRFRAASALPRRTLVSEGGLAGEVVDVPAHGNFPATQLAWALAGQRLCTADGLDAERAALDCGRGRTTETLGDDAASKARIEALPKRAALAGLVSPRRISATSSAAAAARTPEDVGACAFEPSASGLRVFAAFDAARFAEIGAALYGHRRADASPSP